MDVIGKSIYYFSVRFVCLISRETGLPFLVVAFFLCIEEKKTWQNVRKKICAAFIVIFLFHSLSLSLSFSLYFKYPFFFMIQYRVLLV